MCRRSVTSISVMKHFALSVTILLTLVLQVSAKPSSGSPSANRQKTAQSASARERERTIKRLKQLVLQKRFSEAIKLATNSLRTDPKDASYYTYLGIGYNGIGDNWNALGAFSAAIDLDPSGELYYFRSATKFQLNKFDAGLEDANKGIKIDPKNPNLYVWQAGCLFKTGDSQGAMIAIQKAIELAPNDRMALNFRGDLYERSGRYDLAIKDFTKCIAVSPNVSSGYQRRASAEYEMLETDKAIADATRAIEMNKMSQKETLPYNTRGLAWARLNQYKKGVEDISQAIALDPAPIFFVNRGSVHMLSGEYDLAISDFTSALKRDPRYTSAYGFRGIAYENKGDHAKAAFDFTRAIALDPESASYYRRRGQAYYSMHKYDRALSDFKTANSLEIDFTEDYYMSEVATSVGMKTSRRTTRSKAEDLILKALSAEDQGDNRKAIAILSEALKVYVAHPTALRQRALLYVKTGETNRAIADFTVALSHELINANLFLDRGTAYLAAKQFAKAGLDFKTAIACDPKLPAAYYYKALCEDKQGHAREALTSYKMFEKLAKAEIEAQKTLGSSGNNRKGSGIASGALHKSTPTKDQGDRNVNLLGSVNNFVSLG